MKCLSSTINRIAVTAHYGRPLYTLLLAKNI